MIPLVRSGFGYAVYFGTAILILSLLGFNPMPFLARRAPIFVGTDERYPSEVIIRVWKVD